MIINRKRLVKGTCCLLLAFFNVSASAQADVTSLCPTNIDFETGTFQNWKTSEGAVSVVNNKNFVFVTNTPPKPGRHTIMANSTAKDPYGGFPVNCPNSSGYSVKLGNANTGSEAERISYTFVIPATDNEYSIVYNYAVVFEDPNHSKEEQPRFTAKVFDVAANEYINCSTFEYVATGHIPGFKNSSVAADVLYKDWTPVTINLSGYAGKTITLEFTTVDCTQGGHFGYAYVDVNSGCESPVMGGYICPGSNSVTITAPHGFQGYTWFNADFSEKLGENASVTLNPVPPIGTRIALDIVPYFSYGCRDTVYATIKTGILPLANAGTDKGICPDNKIPLTLGGPAVNVYAYNWAPSAGLSNPIVANPTASPSVSTNYIVKVTNPQTGCSNTDTVLVAVESPPSPIFTIAGALKQCITNNSFQFNGTAATNATFLWKFGDGVTSPQHSATHTYASPGTYPVKLVTRSPIGCADSSIQSVTIHPKPNGIISTTLAHICEGFPTAITASGGVSYNWYKDGVLLPVNNTNTFNASQGGTYTTEIIDANGCKNMVSNNIALPLIKKPVPNFNYKDYCAGLPINLVNNTILNSSAVDYLWDFGNGTTSTQQTPSITYATAGTYDIKLSVSPKECPQSIATKQKVITLEQPIPGITYNPKNASENDPLQLYARNIGAQYKWSPGSFLNTSISRMPVYNGTKEQLYTIEISNPSGCTTIDTQLVRIFKEQDIFVARAFTPNGDGKNDFIFPYLAGVATLKSFKIINRWGVLVYSSNTELPGWDGKYKGVPQPMDGYVWEVEGVDGKGNVVRKKGTLTLIR